MNHDVTESASDLSDPTLPVICLDVNGSKIDRLYGYVSDMDPSDLRDALIPMSTDQELSLSYKANNNKIISVSYEITAPDTGVSFRMRKSAISSRTGNTRRLPSAWMQPFS